MIALFGAHSMFDDAGAQARAIDNLWWIAFAICSAGLLAVVIGVVGAVLRRCERGGNPADIAPLAPAPDADRRAGHVVRGAVLTVAFLLAILLGADIAVRHGQSAERAETPAVEVAVIGHQWWWEFQYQDTVPSQIVTTANELHLPVGKLARLDLRSDDVIHSFWVPSLAGKKDLIPGRPTAMNILPEKPGVYAGQCAEFCGMQHATMRMTVVVESEDSLQAWLAAQRQNGAAPATDAERHGQEIFLSGSCAMCHAIGGTRAMSHVGPDLTHVASRQRIASGTLLNTPDRMAAWIHDPQHIRPGVRMPPDPMPAADLSALTTYLESLK